MESTRDPDRPAHAVDNTDVRVTINVDTAGGVKEMYKESSRDKSGTDGKVSGNRSTFKSDTDEEVVDTVHIGCTVGGSLLTLARNPESVVSVASSKTNVNGNVLDVVNESKITNAGGKEGSQNEECNVLSSSVMFDVFATEKKEVNEAKTNVNGCKVFGSIVSEENYGGEKKGIENSQERKDKNSGGELIPGEKWRILRNVILLSISYLVLFTAFKGAGNLQSSINMEGGLGTSSLMAYYGAFIVSSVFLPVIMIQRLGCKWTITISALMYAPFMAAQFHAQFSTLVPGALVAGVGAGPIWCAMCTYTMVVAEAYSRLVGISTETATTKFYGLFYMIYQLSQVSGNLISSLVFSENDLAQNVTLVQRLEIEESVTCGATFCPGANTGANPNLERPPEEQITLLSWIYLVCVLLAAVIIALAIDSLDRYDDGARSNAAGVSGFSLLAVTIKLLKHPYQLLLMPISIFFGMEKAFLGAEYTAVYVSCAVGIHNIGYTMICYGVTNSASSFLTSALVRLVGRRSVMGATVVLHVALLVALLLWTPGIADVSLLYVLAAIWGILDGVWLVQLNTLTGLLFPGNEEAAYSNYHLWESLGYIACYGCSNILCTDVKLYVILAFLVVGSACYGAIEWAEKRKEKQ